MRLHILFTCALWIASISGIEAQEGKVGINITSPKAMLHVQDSSVLFSGPVQLPVLAGQPPVSGAGTRMMWYPNKAALRAGSVTGTHWDKDSIGAYSVAFGMNAKASGISTFVAGGENNKASGTHSFAGGGLTNKASGNSSVVIGGQFNTVSGTFSFTGGGYTNTASGNSSVVIGGQFNTASGNVAFTGGGFFNTASGLYSFAGGGIGQLSRSYSEATFGMYNTDYTPVSPTSIHANDRLFVIGNGISTDSRSNAITVLKNGNMGIGTDIPFSRLHLSNGALLITGTTGTTPTSGAGTRMMWIPNKGAYRAGKVSGAQWDHANIGEESFVGGGENNEATGIHSFVGGGFGNKASATNTFVAGGLNNISSNAYAFVGGGYFNTASGIASSIVGGEGNTASGEDSFIGGGNDNSTTSIYSFIGGGVNNQALANSAFIGGGQSNTASGILSFVGGGIGNTSAGIYSFTGGGSDNNSSGLYAFIGGGQINAASGSGAFIGGGQVNTASGQSSFVGGGHNLFSRSYSEAVFGVYNTDYTPVSATGFSSNDRLFVIGNGTSTANRSNAVTVLKNGRVGIGTSSPDRRLHVQEGVTNASANGNAVAVFERTGNNYITILADSDAENGILFSLPTHSADGAIIYNNSATLRGMLFRTGGNLTRMTILDDGKVGIGTQSPTHPLHLISGARCTVAGVWTNASDGRLKEGITPIRYGIETVKALSPVSYKMRSTGEAQIGFIAQEVAPLIPEIVSGSEGDVEVGEVMGISYGNLTAVLVKAIQEQQVVIEGQKEIIAEQGWRIADLEAKVAMILSQQNGQARTE